MPRRELMKQSTSNKLIMGVAIDDNQLVLIMGKEHTISSEIVCFHILNASFSIFAYTVNHDRRDDKLFC